MNIKVIGCSFFWRFAQGAGHSVAARPMISLHSKLTMDICQVEQISKALADATRLRILEAISATNHMNCGEIVSMRGVTPATVSHHLKILSEAGLIACRREGQCVYSRAVPETIGAYTQALAKMARGRKTRPRPLKRSTTEPQPK